MEASSTNKHNKDLIKMSNQDNKDRPNKHPRQILLYLLQRFSQHQKKNNSANFPHHTYPVLIPGEQDEFHY